MNDQQHEERKKEMSNEIAATRVECLYRKWYTEYFNANLMEKK